MKGAVQSTVGAENSQGNFLEEVRCTLRSGRMGMGQLGKEGRDALGRVRAWYIRKPGSV